MDGGAGANIAMKPLLLSTRRVSGAWKGSPVLWVALGRRLVCMGVRQCFHAIHYAEKGLFKVIPVFPCRECGKNDKIPAEIGA